MRYFFAGIMAFTSVVIAYQIRNETKEKNGQFLLVSVPEYAKSLEAFKQIKEGFIQAQKRQTMLMFVSILPILFLNSLLSVIYLVIWLILTLISSYLPMRKYREKLLKLKEEQKWPMVRSQYMKTDLKLTIHMQNYRYSIIWFLLPLFLETLTTFLAFHHHLWLVGISTVLMIMILLAGCWVLFHLSNQAYCDDYDKNLFLNKLRREQYQKAWCNLTGADAIFMFGLLVLMKNETLSYWTLLLGILLILFLFLEGCHALLLYRKEVERVNATDSFCDDHCWKIGLFGPVYDNPYDPKFFVTSPSGLQMAINHGKAGARYVNYLIIAFTMIFLGSFFGYPYYLNTKHVLSNLTITEEYVSVTSPFYEKIIPLEEIEDVCWVDHLGPGRRVWGTDALVYQSGHYHYERYGDCEVYVASLSKGYLVIQTKQETVIINDDKPSVTKEIYEQIERRIQP